ncbi:KGGVGR-motif variant AAA ATPase [Candidatus Frankia nodulisporulans]|uniref:KGGVGR-motif variant AAA ATPase n=1 Tax=Candidatus Frankia nodulisporulans TaxID=2060052 RepID=UPI001582397E|nr:ParA family protein [Candidatus Frankia nodulisporulans]
MPDRTQVEADAVRERILDRLGRGDPWDEVQVVPDPFRGYRIQVVSGSFRGQTPSERRGRSLGLIVADDDIAFMDFLSPEESATAAAEGAGDPLRPEVSQLPLWPDSLARGEQRDRIEVRLPSRSDDFLSAPLVATFYSLRGGVGRSTALAHTALLLAQDHRVLCIDMDLEAPGLAALFDVERRVGPDQGVVSLLLGTEIAGELPDVTPHLLRAHPDRELYLLPAGHPDANYARRLAQLDPASWYREESNPLRMLLSAVGGLRIAPQIVLIDARTGISPLSAPLLFDLADLAVVTFFPHPQSRVGTGALTRALLAARSERAYTPEPRFLVSPVPGAGSPETRRRYEDRAATWISEWLAPAVLTDGQPAFPDVDELLHVVGYSEDMASTDAATAEAGGSAYAPVSEWIKGFVPRSASIMANNVGGSVVVSGSPSLVTTTKAEALAGLRMSAGIAEAQSDDEFEQTYLRTGTVQQALRADRPLIRGRKGTGKTALFRRLAMAGGIAVTSPSSLQTRRTWTPSSDTFKAVGSLIAETSTDWRVAWAALIGVTVRLYGEPRLPEFAIPGGLVCVHKPEPRYTEIDLVRDLRSVLSVPDAGLLVWQWIRELDAAIDEQTFLLFDGLDAGFGPTAADLTRRREGVAGLLALLGERGDELSRLRMKVLIREDIYRSVPVPNQSHFYGREVRLSWADQTDYLKVVIKQALRAAAVADLVRHEVPDALPSTGAEDLVESWSQAHVLDVWRVLVGERVSGGKTAFTHNWVWNRLADSNGDHSPRSLIRLFDRAAERERGWYESAPYERSLIRPRALVESLEDISDQEVLSVEEEYPELGPLFEALRAVGRTPFPAGELAGVEVDVVNLGLEVGLLGVDLGSRDDAERYRVPELYRKALGMGRKGQA